MTADADIPKDVQAFLRDYIESYEELEVLLLLHRLRGGAYAIAAITAQLPLPGINSETTEALVARGLLSARRTGTEPVYAYAPEDPEVDATVARLAQSYASVRLSVMKLMTANAMDRLRASALHTFADAFVFGRKKKRDG